MKQSIETSPPPFPIDALPEKTRQVVAAIHGLSKAPVPLIVSSVLSALSMAALGRYRLQHEDGRITVPSLFMINICDAGNVKTEVASRAFAGIRQAEKTVSDSIRERWLHQVKAATLQVQAKASTSEVGQEQRDPTSQPVHPPTLVKPVSVSQGFTPETPPKYQLIYPVFGNELNQAVAKRQHTAVVINTEADHVFAADTLSDLDRFCSGWDCHDLHEPEAFTLARNLRNSNSTHTALPQIGSDRDLRWQKTHISASLCVRSQVVQSHVEERTKNACASGFIDRSLFTLDTASCNEPILTFSSGEQVMRPFAKAMLVLDDFKNKTCLTALPIKEYTLKLDFLAAFLQTKTAELNQEFRGYCDSLSGFDAYLSYQRENILRIALLLFCMERSNAGGRLNESDLYLDEDYLDSAYQLVRWHLYVYLEIFTPSMQRPSAVQADTHALETWLTQKQLGGSVTVSPGPSYLDIEKVRVMRSGPFRGVGGAQRLTQALKQLIKQGKVEIFDQALPNNKAVELIRFKVCAESQAAPTDQRVPNPAKTPKKQPT